MQIQFNSIQFNAIQFNSIYFHKTDKTDKITQTYRNQAYMYIQSNIHKSVRCKMNNIKEIHVLRNISECGGINIGQRGLSEVNPKQKKNLIIYINLKNYIIMTLHVTADIIDNNKNKTITIGKWGWGGVWASICNIKKCMLKESLI